jgi:hypothetical protein
VDFVSLEGIETLVDTAVELLQELWKTITERKTIK